MKRLIWIVIIIALAAGGYYAYTQYQARQAQAAQVAQGAQGSGRLRGIPLPAARPLRAYLTRCCGNPSLADDLLQEGFVGFVGQIHSLRSDTNGLAYLFASASHFGSSPSSMW